MIVTAIRNAVLIAAAGALAACADSPITSPARAPQGAGPALDVAGGQPKVDVCHRMARGYIKITVGAPAVPAHLAHGDMYPGTPTPDGLWYMTEDCRLIPNGIV